MSFKIKAIISHCWIVFIPLAFMGDELDEGGDVLLSQPRDGPQEVLIQQIDSVHF